MVRKIRVAFVVALVGYILVYLGITYYVNSTVGVDPSSICVGDVACLQASIARTLQVDMTLYSLIGALALAVLAWMVVPVGKRKRANGQRAKQDETLRVGRTAAQPTVAQAVIKCPRCGTDNAAATKFCVECGQSLVPPSPAKTQCAHCGADNVAANKFCVDCGQSLLPPPPSKLQCAHCGAENAAASKFCVECGQSLLLPPPAKKQCAHCGAMNEPRYTFCTDCGTSLAVPQMEPETQGAISSSSISEIPVEANSTGIS